MAPELEHRLLFHLLNLSKSEFALLKRSPMQAYKNKFGVIISYFVHIKPENDPEVMKKLKLGNSYFITFTVEEITILTEKYMKRRQSKGFINTMHLRRA